MGAAQVGILDIKSYQILGMGDSMAFNDRFFPLSPMKQVDKPIRIMAFDTEDNGSGVGTNFIVGCIYEGESPEEQHIFWSRRAMRDYIFRHHNYSTMAVAHNLRYDLDNIDYPEKTAERLHAKTKLIGAVYHYGHKMQMRMLDTGNFFVGASIHSLGNQLSADNPGRFDKLGCTCDIKKAKDGSLPYDDEGLCKTCGMFAVGYLHGKTAYQIPQKARRHIEEYCMRDAEICYRTMRKLMEMSYTHKTRFKAFTAPSLACRIFRTNYMKTPWKKREMLINDVERLAYYGGRTEVFDYRYFEYVYTEDIKSSYPRAMHDEIYPFPPNVYHMKLPLSRALQYEGISLVKVRVPPMHIPPLPYRRGDGKLIFPVGTWVGAYCHPELKMAMRHGVEILECYDSLIYPDTFTPFSGYIKEFYQKKETTKGIEKDFYKHLLNDLSGKWGEKRIATLTWKEDDPKLADIICQCDKSMAGKLPLSSPGTNLCSGCCLPAIRFSNCESHDGYLTIAGCRQTDPKNAFPVLIAYITAYGRIKLFEERLSEGNTGKTIIYSDTDSAMSDHRFTFRTGVELGDWDMQTYEGFLAYAPKYYDFAWKEYVKKDPKTGVEYMKREQGMLKLKGIPRRHEIVYDCPYCLHGWETPEEVWKTNGNFCCNCYAKLSDDCKRYKFERPLKTSEAERRHMAPNTWVTVKKHIKKIDDKRIKESDGTSSPVSIDDTATASFIGLLEKKKVSATDGL